MARFTKALRQQIVRDFATQNGGWFDPAAFLASVRECGPEHPAWSWFEWDDANAANEFRIDQARDFARGLVVRFEVQTLHRGSFKIVEASAPLALSPVSSRKGGGGYFITDGNDPDHIDELCRQAAGHLRWFVSRYEAALLHAGIQPSSFEKAQAQLDASSVRRLQAA